MRDLRRIWPFRHFGLKLLAIGFAVVLWMFVAGEETVERGLRVPLELQQFPAGLELQGESPSTVDVRVRGGSAALSRLAQGDVVAVLDLRGAHAGRRLFHLTPDQVRTPFGVEVVQVNPPSLAFVLENSATKLVPVVPDLDGSPAPGFTVGKMSVDPAKVEIIGPESAVSKATRAVTEPVSIAGARDRIRETVTVGVLDATLRLRTLRSAMVDVQIVPAPLERTIHGLPVRLQSLSPSLSARSIPATVDVNVRGSREGLSHLGSDDITAYVDLDGVGAGEYTLQVRADATQDVGVIRVDPATVQVRVVSGKN